MNFVKSLVASLATFTIALAAGDVYAQQQDYPTEQPVDYKKVLDADSTLAEMVLRVQESYQTGVDAILEDPSIDPSAKREKIKALGNDTNRKLEAILNPEQQMEIIPTEEPEKQDSN